MAALNLLDPATFAQGHPHQLYDDIRATTPVYRHPGSDAQPPFWALLRHADIEAVSRDGARFTSMRGFRLPSDQRARMAPDVQQILARTVIGSDPPIQQQLRRVVQSFFLPAGLRRIEQDLTAAVSALFASLEGREQVEFVTEVAAVIPIKMISLVLGIPASEEHRVWDWTNRILGSDDPDYAGSIDDASDAYRELFDYSDWLVAQRRAAPTDDLVSMVTFAEIDGRPLERELRAGYVAIILAAGNDTTRNSLSGALMALEADEDARAMLRRDPSLIAAAVPELLRFVSPVIQMMRVAKEDVSVGEERIAAGERVVMLYGAGNHDPAMFDAPHRLDFARANRARHLAFGIGVHHCIGNRLATAQLELMLSEILRRFPDWRIDGTTSLMRTNFVWGVKTLPVRLAP